jgi:hypothetical protein
VTKTTKHEIEFIDNVAPPTDDFTLRVTRHVGNASVTWGGDIDTPAPEMSDVPPVPGVRRAWWPAPVDSLSVWCKSGDVVQEAELRLTNSGVTASDRAISRELVAMWREAGRVGGTPDSIRKIRSSRA